MGATIVELCAGTASVSLYALGRPGCRPAPLTGYMGSKRRWAADLCRILGVADRQPDQVVLVDAGPWGDVWSVLSTAEGRASVLWWLADLEVLRGGVNGAEAAWARATEPPSAVPGRRVAGYLWAQGTYGGAIPIWYSGGSWESGASGAFASRPRTGPTGLQRPSVIARRIRDLEVLPWDRIEVVHGDNRLVHPIPGASVYLDPPYVGCPRYAELLPRADVLELAGRWAAAGARVLVSEAEPLPLPGWTSRPLPGRKAEWLTASWPIALAEQLALGAA